MILGFDNVHFILFILFIIVVLISLIDYLTPDSMTELLRYPEEKYYLDVSTDPPCKKMFQSLKDEYSKSMSIIVPAYNETNRLPLMLDECVEYLENRVRKNADFSYEIIVVDDGSYDDTSKVALQYASKYGSDKLRVLTLIKNRGKGGAVRLGMFSARGKILLFADADGATKFHDIEKLEIEMNKVLPERNDVVIVGSRAHLEKKAIASRSFFRTFLMYGFHFLVWFFCVRTIRDTQCGFKMFTREAARNLFSVLHVERWAFDVELLYIAEKKKMLVKEVAVNWSEVEGSKLVPFWSWLQMGFDLGLIWLKYQLGTWSITDQKKES